MDVPDSSQLITIGEFARLGGVSIKAVRLYGKLGLLHPAVVKSQSRYRLYSRAQISKLQKILLLKNAGVPLAEIGGQLSHRDEATLSRIRESLVLRGAEIQRQLSWVEAEICAARNGISPDVAQVVMKRIPKMSMASQRGRIDSYEQADIMIRDLGEQVPSRSRLVSGAIWHDCGRKTKVIDCEAFWILNRGARAGSPKELAPATVASILHEGDESAIGSTYEIARRWITDNRFQIAGPIREIYLGTAGTERSETTTEIQFPIGRC
jgi:DNA-binding transcriptional MerR regulator